MGIYANLKSFEGSLNGTETITFPWPSRIIEVINDSSSEDLEIKFKDSSSFTTLKPTEVLTITIRVTMVIINSNNSINYRIRVIG